MTFWSRSAVQFLRSAKCNQFRGNVRLSSESSATAGKSTGKSAENSPFPGENFVRRHIGPAQEEIQIMLHSVNCKSLQELTEKVIPNSILFDEQLKLDGPKGISNKLHQFFFYRRKPFFEF